MNIEELIPVIEKEAKKLSRSLWEDLAGIGLIKVWLLMEKGNQLEEAMILKTVKNAMIDYLRMEKRKPKVVRPASDRNHQKQAETAFQAMELEEFLNSLKPTLRRAIRKRLNGKALSSAERVALCRFRKSGNLKVKRRGSELADSY